MVVTGFCELEDVVELEDELDEDTGGFVLEELVVLDVLELLGLMDGATISFEDELEELVVLELLGLMDGATISFEDVLLELLGLIDGATISLEDVLLELLGVIDGATTSFEDVLLELLGVIDGTGTSSEGVLLGLSTGSFPLFSSSSCEWFRPPIDGATISLEVVLLSFE